MTVGTYISFILMRSWFFFRRALRMVKRFYKGLVTWWVLLPFLPLAWLAYQWTISAFPVPEANVPIEMLGIVLGSSILLIMKDFADSERCRHQMLEKQLRIYNNYRWKLENGLKRVQDASSLLSSFYNAGSTSVDDLDPAVRDFLDCLNDYADMLDKLQDELGRSELADFSSVSYGYSVDGLSRGIADSRKCVSDHSFGKLQSALESMPYDNKAVINNLRTPWNYRNDKAHEELIDNLLTRKAVKL